VGNESPITGVYRVYFVRLQTFPNSIVICGKEKGERECVHIVFY